MCAWRLTNVLVQQQVSACVQQMLGRVLRNIVHWVCYRDVKVEDLHDSIMHLDHVVIPSFSPLLVTHQVGHCIII